MAWTERYNVGAHCYKDCGWLVKIYGLDIDPPEEVEQLIGREEDAVRFEFSNDSDSPFSRIKATRAIICVVGTEAFKLLDLYTANHMRWLVEIYKVTSTEELYWTGYVDPKQYQESYDPPPYAIEIHCTDGLSLLKNIDYNDGEDSEGNPVYYNDRILESEVFLQILGKIGFTEFKEFINVYETRMVSGYTNSPMDQLYIDVDVFQGKDCEEVLTELLKKYNASIRQIDGVFCIYRPKELAENTVYGRHFTDSTTKTGIINYPIQHVRRATLGASTIFKQAPGGTKSRQHPARKVTIAQNYGYKESWLDNHKLRAETYKDGAFQNWTPSSLAISKPIGQYLPKESEGCTMQGLEEYDYAKYNKSVFGHNAVTSATDVFMFEFEYLLHNYSLSVIYNAGIVVTVRTQGGEYYLREVDDEYCVWDNSVRRIQRYPITVLQAHLDGATEWVSYKRKILGLPMDGPYEFYFHPIFSPGTISIRGAVRNVVFRCTSDEISVIKKPMKLSKFSIFWMGETWAKLRWLRKNPDVIRQYEDVEEIVERDYAVKNDNQGDVIEQAGILGDVSDTNIDNVMDQFAGSLVVKATILQYRIDTITLTGSNGAVYIRCDGNLDWLEFNESLEQSAADFVTLYGGSYLGGGVVVTSNGANIIFTSNVLGAEFTGNTEVMNDLGNMDGTVAYTQPAVSYETHPTELWSRRGKGDYKPLLQIMAEEIAEQYDSPKEILSIPIIELGSNNLNLNMLGSLVDLVNVQDDEPRIFVFNRGTLQVRKRKWYLDIIEVGRGLPSEGVGSITADNTVVTVDDTTITVDEV